MRTNTVSGLAMFRTYRVVNCPMADGRLCTWGVNTDNMSLLGLTLDYGPFGFLMITNPVLFVITRIIKGVIA